MQEKCLNLKEIGSFLHIILMCNFPHFFELDKSILRNLSLYEPDLAS